MMRIAERGIALSWVEATIATPDWSVDDGRPGITRSFKAISAAGDKILRVAHRPDGNDIAVITALLPSEEAMMKVTYDPQADAFYARFAPEETTIANTVEAAPNVMLDLDAQGELVGIEVLGVAHRLAATKPAAARHDERPRRNERSVRQVVNEFDLTGRACVVTGGGRGIGRAVAEGFVRHGATPVLSGRTEVTLTD
jgi:uncharacterized protein YuzE